MKTAKLFALLLLLLLGAAAVVVAQVEVEEDEAAVDESLEDEGEAQLMVRRTFLNDSFAEGVPMHVRLELWNIGTKEAVDVETTDNYPESFGGPVVRTWEKILPNENVTAEYVVTPTEAGKVIVGRVAYTYGRGAEAMGRRGMGDLGWQIVVETAREHAHRTDPHYIPWAACAIAAIAAVGVPFLMWKKKL